MGKGDTRKKTKGKLVQIMNIDSSKTSFSDFGEKELVKGFVSSQVDAIGMERNFQDYTLCTVYVIFNSRINIQPNKHGIKCVLGNVYAYYNVDINDWGYLRGQAMRGNSMGKAVGKTLKDSHYEYENLTKLGSK